MSKSKSFLMGAMLGAAVGSFTALILAPKKGEELRKELKGHAGKYSTRLEKVLNELEEKGKVVGDEVKAIGQEILRERAAQKAQSTKSEKVAVEEAVIGESPTNDEGSDQQETNTESKTNSNKKRRFFRGV